MCLMKETSDKVNLDFSLFSLMPLFLYRSNRDFRRWSWFSMASSLVSATPKIKMSSKIRKTTKVVSRRLWNSSGAGEIPNGILDQQ